MPTKLVVGLEQSLLLRVNSLIVLLNINRGEQSTLTLVVVVAVVVYRA